MVEEYWIKNLLEKFFSEDWVDNGNGIAVLLHWCVELHLQSTPTATFFNFLRDPMGEAKLVAYLHFSHMRGVES